MAETDAKPKAEKKTADKAPKDKKDGKKIVNLRYCAYFAEDMKLFDTTEEDKAKEAGAFDEKFTYKPMVYITGSNMLFPALEKAIEDAKPGKVTEISIPCEEAAGPRDPKLIEMYRDKEFYRQEINPYPGLRVTLGDRTGTVLTAAAGRVKVDFNSPLAGHDLTYRFSVSDPIEDPTEKAKAILETEFGTSEGFEFDISKDKVSVTVSDMAKFNQNWTMARFKIVSDMRSVFGVDRVEFVEVWASAKKEDKEEKEAPAEE